MILTKRSGEKILEILKLGNIFVNIESWQNDVFKFYFFYTNNEMRNVYFIFYICVKDIWTIWYNLIWIIFRRWLNYVYNAKVTNCNVLATELGF